MWLAFLVAVSTFGIVIYVSWESSRKPPGKTGAVNGKDA